MNNDREFYRDFRDFEVPTANFERARIGISTPFDYYDLDLSTANVNLILPLAGDFLYVDAASTGNATLELNNEHDAPKAPFLVQAGFALNAVFKQIKITNAAQPGKKLRMLFSTGERVVPANSAVIQINGTVSTLEDGFSYGASYKSITALLANTPEVVFTPAANVNGAIVHTLEFAVFSSGANIFSGYVAKNAAPASVLDGDLVLSPDGWGFGTGSTYNYGSLKKPIKIAAGKGLYYISSTFESGALRSSLYTLL